MADSIALQIIERLESNDRLGGLQKIIFDGKSRFFGGDAVAISGYEVVNSLPVPVCPPPNRFVVYQTVGLKNLLTTLDPLLGWVSWA